MAVKIETFGSDDVSWLASEHGTHNARTGTLDVSTFNKSAHYPENFFRAGTPVNAANEGAVKPWTGAAGEVLRFVLRSVPTDGTTDVPAPLLAHGMVKTKRLPVVFTAPADQTAFVFVTEDGA